MTRPLSILTRVVFLVAAAYCFMLFVALHARATDAFFQFLWPIAPPTAAFVGAFFGALSIALWVVALNPRWAPARAPVAGAMVAALALLYAPLVQDEFREDEFILGIAWYAGLAGILIVFAIVVLYQELLVDKTLQDEPTAPVNARRALLIMALIIWFFGLLMTVAPGVLQPRWAWRCLFPGPCLGALPERDAIAIGGVLLGTGLLIGWSATEGSRRAVQVGALFGFLAGATSLYGNVRFLEYIDHGDWGTIGLFALQGALIVVSLAVLVSTRPWEPGQRREA